MRGDYAGAYLETSGTSSQPIVFQAFGSEAPSITADNPTTPDGINLEGASYVTVQGFTINGRSRAGIRAVTCDHVTIRNNHIDGNGDWGIFTGFCDDLLIENNVACEQRRAARHLRQQQRRSPRHPRQHDLRQHAAGIHMNGDVSKAATASSATRSSRTT